MLSQGDGMVQSKDAEQSGSAPPDGATDAPGAPDRGESAPKRRDWEAALGRAVPIVGLWLVILAVAYGVALRSPEPGSTGAIGWLMSPIETNPFRACHGAPAFGTSAPQPPAKASGLLIRGALAQESPTTEVAPNAPAELPPQQVQQPPEQQQQQQQQQVQQPPEQQQQQQQQQIQQVAPEDQQQLPLTDEVTGCSDQGFGDLVDVAMDTTGERAWAINAFGQVYRTVDGGRNWERRELPELADFERLIAVAVSEDGATVIAAALQPSGRIYSFYRSDDAGDTWRAEPDLTLSPVNLGIDYGGIVMTGLTVGPQASYVLAVINEPLFWRDDSRFWEVNSWLAEPAMVRGLRGHSFGVPGVTMHANGMADSPILSWQRRLLDPSLRLFDLMPDLKEPERERMAFALETDTLHAMAASDSGEDVFIVEPMAILHGNARGEPWSRIDLLPLAPGREFALSSIDVASGTKSIMAVSANALFISHDGGRSFFEPPLGRAPAPWFYVVLLAGPAVIAFRLWPEKQAAKTLVGDRSSASADRPLTLKDADAINIGAYARGLLGVLQNSGTEAPLVIGITGAWGSGKSSVMRMTADLLAENRMPTVWFNAWHHQSEDHLLASLLSNIRRQGIPTMWSRAGLRLRVRLLWQRLTAIDPLGQFLWNWFLLLLVTLLVLGSLVLWLATALGLVPAIPLDAPAVQSKLAAFLGGIADCEADAVCAASVEATAARMATVQAGAIPAFLISMLPLAKLWNVALATRRFDPGKLMASMMPAARNPNLDEQLSFRHRFGEELRATATALAPLRLVIFIDDLDRCRPENVVAVLEAVNFVVSSAECCVILGLDRPYVLRAVRQEFRRFIAMERAERKAGTASPEEDKGRPLDFAEHYLEKLINLFVAVPRLTEHTLRALMDQLAKGQRPAPVERRPITRWLPATAAVLAVIAALLTPVIYATISGPGSEAPPPPIVDAGSAGAVPPTTQQAGPSPAPVVGDALKPEIASASAARSADAPAVDSTGLASIVIIALIVAVGVAVAVILAIRVPPDRITHDTTAFKKEVSVAEKRLSAYLTTPRRAKRFINRVRMFASLFKATKTKDELQALDLAQLDRACVAAGALHTLGRELLLMGNASALNEAEPAGVAERKAWEKAREAAAAMRTAIRDSMIKYYGAIREDAGGGIAQVDELYWRLWEVSDGVQPGDAAVDALMRDAGILRPPPGPPHPAEAAAPPPPDGDEKVAAQ